MGIMDFFRKSFYGKKEVSMKRKIHRLIASLLLLLALVVSVGCGGSGGSGGGSGTSIVGSGS
jgi:hypothetical protein